MTAPIAGVRAAITTALSSLGVPVYTYAPGAASAPYVLLIAGSPYLDPGTGWGQSEVGIDVRIVVSSASGAKSMERLDALTDSAVAALVTAKVGVQAVGPPSADEGSATLFVDIPTLTAWKAE